MKILAIGAHPDDIEIGCGGTLLYLKAKYQAELHTLILTRGEASNDMPVDREWEQEESSRILGIDKRFSAGLPDTAIGLKAAIKFIEDIVGNVEPDVVFTHYGLDTHQDHRVVAEATVSACKNRGNILYYESISSENFQPTLFVDITQTMAKKCQAVQAHASQEKRLKLTDYVTTLAKYPAHRTDSAFMEGFIPRKFIWR